MQADAADPANAPDPTEAVETAADNAKCEPDAIDDASLSKRTREARRRILEETEKASRGPSGEGSGFEEWFYSQRAYPASSIPVGALGRAFDSAIQNNGGARGNPADPFVPPPPPPPLATWIPIGPSTIPDGQTDGPVCCDKNGLPNAPLSPVSGRLSAIAVDPTNPNIVYAGGAQGGVWKTTNALSGSPTWTPVTDHQASLAIGDIAIDPVNPNIIYVGTGEPNGSCDSYYGQGVLRSADGGVSWTLLGGGGTPPGNLGPFVGYTVSKIVIDPATAGTTTSTIVWASTALGVFADGTTGACATANAATNGGLFRSTDSGATWTAQDVPAGAARSAQIHDLALDPANSNTLYVAVRGFPVATGGIWKSTNAKTGSATFTRLAGGYPNTAVANPTVRRITLSIGGPGAPGTLYSSISTGTSNLFGFYRTSDGGATWGNVDGGANGTCNTAGTLVTRVTGPSFVTGATWVGRRFLLNNTTALTVSSVGDADHLTLTSSAGTLTGAGYSVGSYPLYCNGQCFYNMTIGVDPTDGTGNTVYVGGNPRSFAGDTRVTTNSFSHTLWRSLDGGATWFSVSEGDGISGGIHTDDHDIAFDASVTPARVYDGNDGGIWRSDDQGASWTSMNTNIAITQYTGVSTHPTDPTIVLGGTQDNGTNLLNSSLVAPPGWFHSDYGDGGKSLIDQGDPLKMFHTYFNQSNNLIGPASSIDGGVNGPGPDYYAPPGSWNFVGGFGGGVSYGITMSDPVDFYAPIAQHPAFTPNMTYLGTSKVYRNASPRTLNWTVVSPALTKGGAAAIDVIAAFPQLIGGKEVLYTGANDGRIEVSSNVDGSGIATWTVIDAAPLPNRAVTAIALDPNDATANTAFVVFSGFNANTLTTPGHVFKTTNGRNGGAATWTDISGDLPDLPMSQIAIDPTTSPVRIYVGTDIGVFRTLNGGAHWTYLSEGFPTVTVFGLERNPSTGQIVASTHGRGMFQLNAVDVTAPVCGGSVTGPNRFDGAATDQAPGDTGIASIQLQPGSTNLIISSITYLSPTEVTYIVNTINHCLPGSGTVVVSDFNGNTCASTVNLTGDPVPAPPTASNTGPYCVGQTIQLNASTVAGATYAWTGPNGFTSSLQNPIIPGATTLNAGTYSVTVTNASGCTSAAATTNVVVNVCFGGGNLVPDGRAVDGILQPFGGNTYRLPAIADRSYAVELDVPFNGAGTLFGGPSPTLAITLADGVTPLSVATPSKSSCAAGATRRLTFAPSASDVAGGPLVVHVTDPSAAFYRFRIRAMETESFCARWSTNGYSAFIDVQNTTDCPLGGEVDLLDTTGALVSVLPFSLGPQGATQIAIPNGLSSSAGSARLRHDGPQGAVTGGMYMTQVGGSGTLRWPFLEVRSYGAGDGK